MRRLTRDGTVEPVSRDQIFRREREQGKIFFSCSADHEQDWQPYSVDPYNIIHSIRRRFFPPDGIVENSINSMHQSTMYVQQHFGEIKNEVFFKERGLLSLKGPVG